MKPSWWKVEEVLKKMYHILNSFKDCPSFYSHSLKNRENS